MMELKAGKEYWIKARFLKKNEFNENPLYFDINDAIDGLVMLSEDADIREELPEPKKVTIPKFVADWIVHTKTNNWWLGDSMGSDPEMSSELYFWLFEDSEEQTKKNQKLFARAWLDGYEIEKEPLYTVEIPDPNKIGNEINVLMMNGFRQVVIVKKYGDNWKKENGFRLTESEIKKDFEWAWQWAKPVEEE